MKNKTLTFLKKTASAMLVTVMLVGVSAVSAKAGEPQEESGTSPIVYESYTIDEFKKGGYDKEGAGAPEPSATTKEKCSQGYVFGGWFTSEKEDVYSPVLKSNKGSVSGTVYAKFVPAYIMSVKCQNIAGTSENDETATMKFVSATDSSNYADYNFKVRAVRVNKDGTFSSSTDVFAVQNDYVSVDKMYRKFAVYGSVDATVPVGTYEPSALFGEGAKYFTTWGIEKIKHDSFGNIVCIQPTWTTLDGTVVEGLTKYAHVEDGFVHEIDGVSYRYVNVPINLRKLADVAAGVLSIRCTTPNADLEYAKVESGSFFEEMAWADKTDGSVKLVGNTLTIKDKNENDVYANIRFFVKESDANKVITGYDFKVEGEDFSNSSEVQYTSEGTSPVKYDVWDVKY